VITFSLLSSVRDASPEDLCTTIESVLSQTYQHWELRIVDDASSSRDAWSILQSYAKADDRLLCLRADDRGGIPHALNSALGLAAGKFIAVLDPGDVLVPDALTLIANELKNAEETDYCYSDEAGIKYDGEIVSPFYKPDWSPERMRSQLFTGHLGVMRKSLVIAVGGFNPEFEGCHDRELALRVSEKADRILHIPQVLYLWRAKSDADRGWQKPFAVDVGRRAVQAHCHRVGIDAVVDTLADSAGYRVRRRLHAEPLVSIVIPTRGSASRVGRLHRTHVLHAVSSIVGRSTFTNFELVVVADREAPSSVVQRLEQLGGDRLRLVWSDGPFNFSKKINAGVAACSGDVLILLNDDIEVITPDWIQVLVGLVQEGTCGLVGCKLIDAYARLQHGGHVYAAGEMMHAYSSYPATERGMADLLMVDRECSGVTAACVAIRRDVWERVGGMCEGLPVNFNDVDLSLKIRHLGLRIVWTPHAVLSHFESLTRVGREVLPSEGAFVRGRWKTALSRDPYSNPNLDQTRGDWVVGKPPESWLLASQD
jgi:glycosyltransferase involved in cell wall biosynthesis